MKKQASTLLPALLDLLRQYLALDMAVYAGHATLLLLTASLPLLMWVLVIINMLPFYSVSDIAALVAQLLPDIPAIQSMAVDVIANLNNQSTTFMASFAAITTVISASGGMAAVQKGLQKLTPGARKTMFDRGSYPAAHRNHYHRSKPHRKRSKAYQPCSVRLYHQAASNNRV